MSQNQYTPEEPISSIATALVPSALGIVRVSGNNCIELVSKTFSRPKSLLNAKGNEIVYGWIINPQTKQRIDEVMVAVYKSPKSFTGEDMAEIFCHGGICVVTAIQNLMLKNGFRQAERGEYTFRAYINGKTDLTKAEAVKEIIDSQTDVSRSHAVERLSGTLFAEIDSIKKLIIDTLAAIEVEIEYPEDEETIADSFDKNDIETAISRLELLVNSWKSEKIYQDGAKIVLAGRTNAGKSSLFNAILKEERAIVSEIEGTTRDFLESFASINGIPVRLFDTAGLRKTDDKIEEIGVELTKNLTADANLVLYLIDSNFPFNDEDIEFIKNCKDSLIIVYTKKDMQKQGGGSLPHATVNKLSFATPSSEGHPRNAPKIEFTEKVYVSSKNGDGLKELYEKITKILLQETTTEKQQAGLGSQRQKEAVTEALGCVKHAIQSANDNYSLDAVVQDLEDALTSLSEVTGDITPDDVLGSIFENFCVGK